MDNMSLSDIAAVTRGENGDGWGSGSWWIIVLFLFAFMNGGFGLGNRGPNGEPVTEAGLTYAEMSNQELGHADRLHDMAVNEIKLAEQQGREAPDGMRKVWDWEHGRIVDKTAAVRNLLMMLNA